MVAIGSLSCFWATFRAFCHAWLISLLNHYQHFPCFVYDKARHCAQRQTTRGSPCGPAAAQNWCAQAKAKPGPGYDHLGVRRFEFVPVWGCMVVLLYCMRRVDCRACGVRAWKRSPGGSANTN